MGGKRKAEAHRLADAQAGVHRKAKAPGPKRSKVVLEGLPDKQPLIIALMKIFLSNGERFVANGTH
jgi:hypothetical protein